jgi:hypothetical protein
MTEKMNPVAKELWLAALRSGEYTQGRGQLRIDDTFCCLGVLCEVAIKQGVIEDYGPDNAGLPALVGIWAKLDQFGEYESAEGVEDALTDDNDAKNHDFLRIAETIEREF